MGPGRERLFAARAAISADDEERSVDAVDHVQHWLRAVDDPWLHVRRDAMLGELARIQHRFDDAVLHIGRAAPDVGAARLPADRGLPALQPGPCPVPGRRLRDRRRHPGARDRQGRGHRRRAAGGARPACTSAASCARSARTAEARAALEAAAAWHRAAGGGEQAALGECLLAALDAADRDPAPSTPRRDPRRRPGAPTTPPSRSSPSTRSPASPPKRATSPRPGTSARRPIGGWRPPRTSSPSATARSTATALVRAPLVVQHQEGQQPADRRSRCRRSAGR